MIHVGRAVVVGVVAGVAWGWCGGSAWAAEPRRGAGVEETFVAVGGTMETRFDARAIERFGVPRGDTREEASRLAAVTEVRPSSELFQVVATNHELTDLLGGALDVVGAGWVFEHDPFGDSSFEFGVVDAVSGARLFDVADADVRFDAAERMLQIEGDLLIADGIVVGDRFAGRMTLTLNLALSETDVVDESGSVVSATLHPLGGAEGGMTPGADIIASALINCQQFGRVGTIGLGTVGLAIGTKACNKGTVELNWVELPSVNHPVIGQNLYRLRTVAGSERFEQIGQAWIKHAFSASQDDECGFGCVSSGTTARLGVGCSDAYSTATNSPACSLAPRSVVQPYTGVFVGGASLGSGGGCVVNFPSKNHLGHVHSGISHRIQVPDTDLMPPLSTGARYIGEGFYITPQEFTEGNGNQFNNTARREYSVSGPNGSGLFTFTTQGASVAESTAMDAWTGSSRTQIQPAPTIDGRAFLVYKVTDLGAGRWHYEYGLYNMNLDRSIRSFAIPIPPGVTVSNVEFHAPMNHAAEPNADTYSNDPWDVAMVDGDLTWSTATFAADPLANAIRFGTMYTFRFDANTGPRDARAMIGLFKTGDVIDAACSAPAFPIAPVIVHGAVDVSVGLVAFGGYIDPRAESNNGTTLNLGLSALTIRFSEPVRAIGGGALTAAAFAVRETGAVAPPTVVSISTADSQTVTLQLSRIITLQEWTTVEAHVENLAGIAIENHGDLGALDELDRIDVAFLPGDVNKSENVNPLDLLQFKQYVNGLAIPGQGVVADYVDINRSGGVNPLDLLAFKQLVNGVGNATRVWSGKTMNHARP